MTRQQELERDALLVLEALVCDDPAVLDYPHLKQTPVLRAHLMKEIADMERRKSDGKT